MSEPRDEFIPISCGECGAYSEGLNATISHIIDFHPKYSLTEAKDYAEDWLETAIEIVADQNRDFYRERKEFGGEII